MSKLSKEQIDTFKNYSSVSLKCDGFYIQLLRVVNGSKVKVFVTVNKTLNVDWGLEPTKYEESKFFRPWVKRYKKTRRSKKMTTYDTGYKHMSYASMGQALRYLNKVCDSVEYYGFGSEDDE